MGVRLLLGMILFLCAWLGVSGMKWKNGEFEWDEEDIEDEEDSK